MSRPAGGARGPHGARRGPATPAPETGCWGAVGATSPGWGSAEKGTWAGKGQGPDVSPRGLEGSRFSINGDLPGSQTPQGHGARSRTSRDTQAPHADGTAGEPPQGPGACHPLLPSPFLTRRKGGPAGKLAGCSPQRVQERESVQEAPRGRQGSAPLYSATRSPGPGAAVRPAGTQAGVVLLVQASLLKQPEPQTRPTRQCLSGHPTPVTKGREDRDGEGSPRPPRCRESARERLSEEGALAAPEDPGGQRTWTKHEGTPACPTEGPHQGMSAWKEPVEGMGKSNTQRSRGPGTVPTGQAGNPQRTQREVLPPTENGPDSPRLTTPGVRPSGASKQDPEGRDVSSDFTPHRSPRSTGTQRRSGPSKQESHCLATNHRSSGTTERGKPKSRRGEKASLEPAQNRQMRERATTVAALCTCERETQRTLVNGQN